MKIFHFKVLEVNVLCFIGTKYDEEHEEEPLIIKNYYCSTQVSK